MKVKACRICSSRKLTNVLKLGKMPSVNYFLSDADLSRKEEKYPLNLSFCKRCGLVLLDEVVAPEKLFRNYHYLTSASQPLVDHFAELAQDCRNRKFLRTDSKVLDIGANDGTLLFEFQKLGAKPLGIDPALNAVKSAARIGITVLPHFFDELTAKRLSPKIGKFDIVTSTNVFAHTDKVKSFLAGIDRLLAPKGVVIMEFAHLLDMIVKNQFDVIYHEHVSFFSLKPLVYLFDQFGMEIFDVKKVLTQGGSLRIYVRRKKGKPSKASARFEEILREEEENHIHEIETLRSFAEQVRQFKRDLRVLVANIRKKGHRIVGLGAPAKGVILLNYCGLGPNDIDYLVDSTELKQGRFFPGNHIPVYSEKRLETEPCDYFLLLSWNFQDAILEKMKPYRDKGAKVIIPFPKLRVI